MPINIMHCIGFYYSWLNISFYQASVAVQLLQAFTVLDTNSHCDLVENSTANFIEVDRTGILEQPEGKDKSKKLLAWL